LPYNRRKEDTEDDAEPSYKKPRLSTDEYSCTSVKQASPVLHGRRDPYHNSTTTGVSVSPTAPRVFHRPFEAGSSAGRSEADAGGTTVGQSSRVPSPVGDCSRPDDDRRDVTSWADCLRQLDLALRRRRVAEDDGDQTAAVVDPVSTAIPSSTGVGSPHRRTTANSLRPRTHKHRDSCRSDYDDVVQRDLLQSVSDEDYLSRNNNDDHDHDDDLAMSKIHTTTAVDTQATGDLRRCSVNADTERGFFTLSSELALA